MKVLVSIPVGTYNGLLGRCSLLSREYLILKNGVINRDREGSAEEAAVEILCEAPRAKFLLDLATLIYPEAAPYIEKSLNEACEESIQD